MFTFTEDCIIGIDELDNEHRHLFGLMGRAADLLRTDFVVDAYDRLKDIIGELEDYAENHFRHEEEYMEKIRDPEILHQRAQHDFFRDKMHSFSFADIDEVESQRKVLEELLEFLAKWLYQHIIGSDIMIGHMPPLEEWIVKENPCEFTEEYETGIEFIDAEHKELFRLIGHIYDMAKSGVTDDDYEEFLRVVDRLRDYTKEHFSDEEEYMESAGYDGLAAQKRVHTAFIAKIEELSKKEVDGNLQVYVEQLTVYLLKWLVLHIMNMDKKIPK